MINVKRNNVFWWIHRGAKKVDGLGWCVNIYDDMSLCKWFWGCLWNYLTCGVVFTLLYILFVVAGTETVSGFIGIEEFTLYWWSWVFAWMIIPTLLAGILGVLMGLIILIETYQNKIYIKNINNPVKKKPNLVIEWLKAKKEKVCPLVKFEEE
ncbi:TMhelix containing protein [Vibrio phage 1.084.O._10N.261.49.F5]|nr:TMhelix containing protein [Vibrio phage 1.084.O._10N.261.49.F5]